MKKRLKWLLVGSLMCLGVGSVFHQGYGMMNDDELIKDETSWKQKAVEAGASQVELKKVKKKFFTYQQIVIGYEYWNKFNKIRHLKDVTNEKKLNCLINAIELGNENAIWCLLDVYRFGNYGLNQNDPQCFGLTCKYAYKGSEIAIDYFLRAYICDSYGDQKYDSEVFKLVTILAINGNSWALRIFNQHKDNVKPNFKRNDKQILFSDVDLLFN